MKRIVTLLVAAVALVATSCQKDDTQTPGKQSGEVDVAIKASLPQSIGTYAAKAPGSDKGGMDNVDPDSYDLRYIMEVWSKGDVPEMVYRNAMFLDDWTASSSVTFNARLLAKEYDFVFWADFVEEGSEIDNHYTTTALNNITFKGTYGIMDDTRDAYYGKQTVDLTNQGATIGGITLKRPFGKLRLISTDKPVNANTSAPVSVILDYGDNVFYKAFDALSGTTSGLKSDQKLTTLMNAVKTEDTGTTYLLSYDYILAAGDLTSLSGVKVKITVGNEVFTKELPTIPVSANKLTTVKGNFYTNEGTLTVDVSDAFDSSDDVNVPNEVVTSTIAGINEAIVSSISNDAIGKPVTVKLTEQVAENANIAIPAAVSAEKTPEITLDLSKAGISEGTKLSIGAIAQSGDVEETVFAGTINVIVPESMQGAAGNLDIKAPNAHVVINGQYNDVTAKTSSTTLVIEKGTTVAKLTVESGNVEIYGTVTEFGTIASGSKIFWGADSEETLRAALAKDATYNHGVILKANISGETQYGNGAQAYQDLFHVGTSRASNNYERTDYDGYIFDGNGFSINGVAYNNLLAIYAHDVTVKNLTLFQSDADLAKKFNNGITVYRSKNAQLENVTINNCGRAGVIVNGSTVKAKDISISNCAWGGVNVSKSGQPNLDEKPEFELLSGSFKVKDGTYPIYVDKNAVNNYAVTVPAAWNSATVLGTKVYSLMALENMYGPADIAALIAGATEGDTINLPAVKYLIANSTVTIDKAVTLKGADNFGTQIVTSQSANTFVVSAAATIEGIWIDKTDKANQHLLTLTASGVTIKNCKFTGRFVNGDNEVSRGIVPNNSLTYTIEGNSFEALRQPAYLEGPGIVKNNFVRGTKGWVVCVNHEVEFTGNMFDLNAVDIAIIANDQTASPYYTDVLAVSAANNGAFVDDQLRGLKAKDGKLIPVPQK